MRRFSPALILALMALVVGAVFLATSRPPGYTLRASALPQTPVELLADGCVALPVLAAETVAVRAYVPQGATAPAKVTLRTNGLEIASRGPYVRGNAATYALPGEPPESRVGALACFELSAGKRNEPLTSKKLATSTEPAAPEQPISLLGQGTTPAVALLGAHRGSWLSALPLLAERVSFGRGTVLGRAALPLALLCIALACGLLVALYGRSLDRRVIVLLGLVGTLWGVAYAVTTPPFQAPDEIAHLRYAQLINDRHTLPQTTAAVAATPPDYGVATNETRAASIPFFPWLRQPWSVAEDRAMDAKIAAQPRVRMEDTYDTASNQPPGYYGMVAAAQAVTRGSILDRLLVARLVSALLFGLAVAGLAVFVREAVPSAGRDGLVGVAMVACLPLTGFIAGSINPDALMTAAAAWTFALTAIVLRRGLTWRRSAALGAAVGVGVLSKLTFTALLPMVVVAALVVLVRAIRSDRATGMRTALMVAASGGVAVAVAAPYVLWAVLSGRGLVFGPPGGVVPAMGIRQTVTFTVGLFFGEVGPIERRLARSGPVDIFGDGLVGRLGWLDYGFPRGAMLRILNAWELLTALALVGVARAARVRRAIPVDALVYAVGVAALMLVIGRASLSWSLIGLGEFAQARYLFPVAAVGAGGVALALRQVPDGRSRTWVASAVLVAVCVHGVLGYLLTIGRYFA